jgi:glucose/arabinose dehydrogenase
VLRVRLAGADSTAEVEGLDPLPGRSHYFIGSDPRRWRTDIPHYARVRFHDVYPGIDQIFYAAGGEFEYDLVVAPGADPSQIRVAFDGADSMRVNDIDDLVLQIGEGEMEQRAPRVYQEIEGSLSVVPARYVVTGPREVRFEIEAYDRTRPLVIDPVLVYSTYLGGASSDAGLGIAADSAGNAYVTGLTSSANFPTVNPVQASYHQGNRDVFVAKIDPTGSRLVYATYLGGAGADTAYGIAVDAAGNACLTGNTGSADFPTSNALQPQLKGRDDAFVTKLNAAGSALLYSTYLGGSTSEVGRAIAVDSAGRAHVTGETYSSDFPVASALQPGKKGLPQNSDVFITKLDPPGAALVYSTYLGGTGSDYGTGIAVDGGGNAHVVGSSTSSDFPTLNARQPALGGGGNDAFVAKIAGSGNLVYSTYLGGSGGESANAIAVDASGRSYITGGTGSPDFPTAHALQPVIGSATVYKSTDRGQSWIALGLDNVGVRSLASERTNPLTLYAGTAGEGIARSTDDGAHWQAVNAGLDSLFFNAVAVDPARPGTVYAGAGRLFKTTTGGESWSVLSLTEGVPRPLLLSLAVDPLLPDTLYAGMEFGVHKTRDGGTTWTGAGTTSRMMRALAVDPRNPSTVYAGSSDPEAGAGGIFKSLDGGQTWTIINRGLGDPAAMSSHPPSISALAIDPANTSIVYAASGYVFKSTDAGLNWTPVFTMAYPASPVTSLAIDPTSPSVVYAGTSYDGVYRSSDSGATWTAVNNGLLDRWVNTVMVSSTGTVYAGTQGGFGDAFVSSLSPDGSSLLYSTYLGGGNNDVGLGIAVDVQGSAYVTGSTESINFPTVQPVHARSGGSRNIDAFVAKIGPGGSALVYSTYLGGAERDIGNGIAADALGHAYVTGQTASTAFPTASALQPTFGGGGEPFGDAFVVKIAPAVASSISSLGTTGVATGADSTAPVPSGGSIPAAAVFSTQDGVRYRVESVATHLDAPWAMSFAPDGRLFMTERAGRVRIFDATLSSSSVALTMHDVFAKGEAGLLGLALDPDFARSQLVYVYYTARAGGGAVNRVLRYRENRGRLIEPIVLLDNIPANTIHNGGRLRFGPDGLLYVTTGDADIPSLAQDLASLGGKILRLNRDGTTPRANPFASPVFSAGHRNPQGIDWHPVTGELWSDEHGSSGNDEVNVIDGGGNFGWPRIEGGQDMPGMRSPIAMFTPAIAPSGGSFYRGRRFGAFANDLFVAALRGQHLLRLRISPARRIASQERLVDGRFGRIRDVIGGPDGFVYFLTDSRNRDSGTADDDRLLRIVPAP